MSEVRDLLSWFLEWLNLQQGLENNNIKKYTDFLGLSSLLDLVALTSFHVALVNFIHKYCTNTGSVDHTEFV